MRCWLAAVAVIISLSGCAAWHLRDEKFSENELSQSVRKARPQKNDILSSGLTEKGRQIERDLHAM
jgi:hypothetical protein